MFNILERLSMEAIEAFYFFISLAVGRYIQTLQVAEKEAVTL